MIKSLKIQIKEDLFILVMGKGNEFRLEQHGLGKSRSIEFLQQFFFVCLFFVIVDHEMSSGVKKKSGIKKISSFLC